MNIPEMMRQAKKMKTKMEQAKNALRAQEFSKEVQGVKIKMLGNRQIQSIEINEAILDEKSMVEALVQLAVNNLLDEIDEAEKR